VILYHMFPEKPAFFWGTLRSWPTEPREALMNEGLSKRILNGVEPRE
jgi:hypothetical protein